MNNNKKQVSSKKVLGYEQKHQLRGRFKVIEYYSNDSGTHKRCVYKNLNMSEAESIIHKLERTL